MKKILRRAMQDCDNYVIELDYIDAKGNRTSRTVSPIRFVGGDRLLALCLCREEPRQFYLDRCENVRLVPAEEVLMPLAIGGEVVVDTPRAPSFSPVPGMETMLCGA